MSVMDEKDPVEIAADVAELISSGMAFRRTKRL